MIRINLIPHRAEFRQQQIIEYIVVFASAILLAIVIVISMDFIVTKDLTALQEESEMLAVKNKELTKKIGELRNLDSLRKDVESKLQIVDELQAGRFKSLVTLDKIAKAIPQNIWLENMRDVQGSITVKGFAESSQAIATFMRAIEKADLFTNVRLSYDKSEEVNGADIRSFSIEFHRLSLAEQENVKGVKE